MSDKASFRIHLVSPRLALRQRFQELLTGTTMDLQVVDNPDGWQPGQQSVDRGVVLLDAEMVLDQHGNKWLPWIREGENFILMGELSELSSLPEEIWTDIRGVLLTEGAEHNLLKDLNSMMEPQRESAQNVILSHLRNLYRQGRDFFGAEHIDPLTTLTLNILKLAFQCDYAGMTIHRQGEEDDYHVSYYMGRSAPIYPSRMIHAPGIVEEGEVGKGMIGGIQRGEGLSSLIWSPIPGENGPGGLFLLGKTKGSFTRGDLEQLILFSAHVARVIQYVRMKVGRRRERERWSREQEAMVKSEKMSSINRLMSSVAHHLNNPLQAIQINLELAMRARIRDQKQDHYLNVVQDEVERLRRIVADMMDQYRPGQREKTWVSIQETIEDALTLFAPELEENGIQVVKGFEEDLPPVWGFTEALGQVFIQLISNAVDAMPRGGELKLETRLQNETITCMIRDNGIGIPEELQDEIFDPFTGTKENCHGLGLTICDNIVTQHQGKIELLNADQEGTTIRISLPIGGQA